MRSAFISLTLLALFNLAGCASGSDDDEGLADNESDLIHKTGAEDAKARAGGGIKCVKSPCGNKVPTTNGGGENTDSPPISGGVGGGIGTGNGGIGSGIGVGNGNGGDKQAAQHQLPLLITWNGVANTEASLDIVLKSGQVIAPCVSVDVLRDEVKSGRSDGLGYLFIGVCPSANHANIWPENIDRFRICSATNNDWANAKCTDSAKWAHTTAPVHIDNR